MILTSGLEFMTPSRSKSPRQAFFARFSQRAMEALTQVVSSSPPLILLTGGLRTPALLYTALSSGHAHLLGIGRGSVLCPNLPEILKHLDDTPNLGAADTRPRDAHTLFASDPDLSITSSRLWSRLLGGSRKISLMGAGIGMAWYIVMIRKLATKPLEGGIEVEGMPDTGSAFRPDYDVGGIEAIFRMWVWWGFPELRGKKVILGISTFALVTASLYSIMKQ